MHIESFILAAGASKRTGKINKLTKKYFHKFSTHIKQNYYQITNRTNLFN